MLQPNLMKTIPSVMGWDVGGAHLKASVIDQHGLVLDVIQVACPLWRGLNKLDDAVDDVLARFENIPELHAITMTGELVDLFETRAIGVLTIAAHMQQKLHGVVQFYAGKKGFVPLEQVALNADAIASANWLASAQFVSNKLSDALFVDVGSTTSDLVLIVDNKVLTRGLSDGERMRSDELVYSGVVRTPLMALASQIVFEGKNSNLAAEHFATTADVYRLTGDLLAEDDMAETADGAGKSPLQSARRLARMIGYDAEYAPLVAWQDLAQAFKEVQLQRLYEAAERCGQDILVPLVGAGTGKFLVAALAKKMNRPFIDVMDFVQAIGDQERYRAGLCLPAYAVAYLTLNEITSA